MKFKLEEAIKSNWKPSKEEPINRGRASTVRVIVLSAMSQAKFVWMSIPAIAKESGLTNKQANNAIFSLRDSGYNIEGKRSKKHKCMMYRI
ncbi:hypothetical protein NVP1029O_75 [Vibrio phage 1.029.O._10N.261.55.A7]|nr:hypothetical protein NVP1029O_75 [Vibrio phage 1.029.O._10N.261.55.A7]